MAKRVIIISFIFFITSAALVFSDIDTIIDKADKLHESENHEQVKAFLLDSLNIAKSKVDKAQLNWRLSRATLDLGDKAEKEGASTEELLKIFEEGESYAVQAIELDPGNHLGYYWKSANIGKWGQTKGILDSLFKAAPMRDLLKKAVILKPDHSDSYYVLGQLYEQLPGFPISFGNVDYSVSLGRKSVDLHEEQYKKGMEKEINYDYYTELAKHLYKRNWSDSKRKKDQKRKSTRYRSLSDLLEKNYNYEGIVELEKSSDREEARKMIKWVISELESISTRKKSQNDDLKEAKQILASW